MQWISVNGELIESQEKAVDIADKGLLLGDGLFETLKVENDCIEDFDTHWQRFKNACERLQLVPPLSRQQTIDQIERLLSANKHTPHASIRWTLTRGSGPRGLKWPTEPTPVMVITSSLRQPAAIEPKKLRITETRRNDTSPLATVKSLNYLDAVLAHNQARQAGFDDAVFLNTKGRIVCSSMANLFFINNNKALVTAGIEEGVLPGITRQKVIGLANDSGVEVIEKAPTQNELTSMVSAFLTNSLMGVVPVASIDDYRFDPALSENWGSAYNNAM